MNAVGAGGACGCLGWEVGGGRLEVNGASAFLRWEVIRKVLVLVPRFNGGEGERGDSSLWWYGAVHFRVYQ